MNATQPAEEAAPATAATAATAAGRGTMQAIVQEMQAIVQDRYGTAPEDVMRLERVASPEIGADEVLVRVRAAGVDRGTWHVMAGQPYLMRLGVGFRGPRNRVPGMDVAGTVVAAGSNVTRLAAGDEVFGIARGSFAEYAVAREDKLVRRGHPAVAAAAGTDPGRDARHRRRRSRQMDRDRTAAPRAGALGP